MKQVQNEFGNFVAFWGNDDVYSQWHPLGFTDGVNTFVTAEQYMMWRKAKLFNDDSTAAMILLARDPATQKKLGRKVKGFNEDTWLAAREDIVFEGNMLKFGQNAEAKKELLATGDATIVEASPYDDIWGIGLGENNKNTYEPAKWRGLNLLGNVLMRVRSELAK